MKKHNREDRPMKTTVKELDYEKASWRCPSIPICNPIRPGIFLAHLVRGLSVLGSRRNPFPLHQRRNGEGR